MPNPGETPSTPATTSMVAPVQPAAEVQPDLASVAPAEEPPTVTAVASDTDGNGLTDRVVMTGGGIIPLGIAGGGSRPDRPRMRGSN